MMGQAQRSALVGVVRDTAGAAIPFAEAVLIGAKRSERANERGWFVFDSLPAGPDLLVVRAIGFRAQSLPLNLGSRDTVELAATLQPRIQVLPEVSVTVHGRRYSGIAAQAAARLNANGAPASGLITREDIETWGQNDLSNVFRRAGLKVLNDRVSCPRPSGSLLPSVAGDRGNGKVAVYIDGTLMSDDFSFDTQAFPARWLEAIEVYKSTATRPVEYNTTGSSCVLLLWTQDARP
jgi:hypothetical protein